MSVGLQIVAPPVALVAFEVEPPAPLAPKPFVPKPFVPKPLVPEPLVPEPVVAVPVEAKPPLFTTPPELVAVLVTAAAPVLFAGPVELELMPSVVLVAPDAVVALVAPAFADVAISP